MEIGGDVYRRAPGDGPGGGADPGISYDVMRQILNFIYTSEMEIALSSMEEILSAACQLQQIPEAIGFCCDFLSARVDPENILDVYRLADLFGLGHLSDC
ncbi:hypothetical protein JD844_015315 [Phrynosoma platyrhinos]|uniref:BTB domain-containing protein n=1 Tax=Phrynosoma platyrhinos TaxID=52577 RepID=A0ABQ7SIU6_PHRPL|nr:hypothetical protein JD844_015315 [Phrynosoma platyrhinos]